MLIFMFLGAVDLNIFWLFGQSPSPKALGNPEYKEASLIYSSDNVLIGKYFTENRSAVRYEDISPYVVMALISTEDERFYQHKGVDYQGIVGAIKDIVQGNPRGASTITQQLAKNMFKMRSQLTNGILCKVPGLSMAIMKAKEWNTAYKLENLYTKKEILTLYLNTVDFGSNAFGIKTAAKTFFNTTPKDLTIEQAATLIGLLKATTYYNPMVNPENSRQRRNVVINNMLAHNMISSDEADKAKQQPILLNYNLETPYDGQAQYFKEAVKLYLKDWLAYNKDYDLYTSGLKIYTTIDTRMQRYAEQSVMKQMNQLQNRFDDHWRGQQPWRNSNGKVISGFEDSIAKTTTTYKELQARFIDTPDSIDYYMNKPHKVRLFSYTGTNRYVEKTMSSMDSIRYMLRFLHCGFMAMEPHTNYVRAWVGDIDFNTWKFDKVIAKRQPGSTFKLFVYATAFEYLGLVPMDKRIDTAAPIKYQDSNGHVNTWNVHNSGGHSSEQRLTIRQAFARSVNTVAARLGIECGISNVISLAKRMGIRTHLTMTPAISLGACDVTLFDMVGAYCCAVNDGMYRRPILVTKILDREGNVIYDCSHNVDRAEQVMSYRTSFFLRQLLLAGTHDAGGTSRAVWSYVDSTLCDVGGKTGTTSNYSDAWFIGCTPNLVAGAWVGGEYRSIHFRNGALGQGARTSLPIFGYFMSKVLSDNNFKKYRAKFQPPRNFIPPTSYSVYTPDEDDNSGNYYEPVATQGASSSSQTDTSHYHPQTDITQGIDVSNAEEQQPTETQIEEEFF